MLSPRWQDSTPRIVSLLEIGSVEALDGSDVDVGEQWPNLLAVLFQLSMAPDTGKRETAFRAFATTPGIIEKHHEDAVAQAFTRGFKDESVSVCES